MTYAAALQRQTQKLDAVLVIDGVPILFGTRAGRVHDGTGVNEAPTAPWTSVAAIIPESIKLGAQEMDWDSMFVKPAKVSLPIAISPAWNRYFNKRTAPVAYLNDTIAFGDALATLNDASSFSVGDYVYMHRETCKIDGKVGNNIGIVRNAIGLAGSSAMSHVGAAGGTYAGYAVEVTKSPRYMLGRPATLRIFAGESDADYVDFTGLRISDSPKYNAAAGTWDFTFDDGMSAFARKIASGVVGMPSAVTAANVVAVGNVDQVVFNVTGQSEFIGGTELGCVLVAPNGGPAGEEAFLVKVESINTGAATFNVNKGAFIARENLGNIGPVELAGASLKRVYVFTQYPMQAVLKVLLSREGDLTNDATWDVLAGKTARDMTDEGHEFAFGANFDAALIDVTTLEGFKDKSSPGWTYMLGARGEEQLLDLLEEAAWALGGFFYVNGSGKLSFRQWTALYGSETPNYTLTEDNILVDSSKDAVDDESAVLHTLSVKANYQPASGDSSRTVTVVHEDTKSLYRNAPNSQAGTLTLERKALWVAADNVFDWRPPLGNAPLNTADPKAVRQGLNGIFNKRAAGIRRYTLTLPWRYSTLGPGDRLKVTHGLLNAFDGSYVNDMTFDVVGVQRSFIESTVTVNVDEVPSAKLVAPCLRIASFAADTPSVGTHRITLSTNNTTWGGGASPALLFASGWTLAVHDRSSTPPFSATSAHVVTGGNGVDTLEVSGALAFTPTAGDLVQFTDYDTAASTSRNAAQNVVQHDYAFLADDTLALGASNANAGKWGT
jgi:hypothetical protein